jgi:sugar/nucleoside kinase (ribokinase family)
VIVVLGRPGITADGRLARAAGRIAQAAAVAGTRVELVGSVGDDEAGEAVALALGVAGVGHAALLRDPAGVTPHVDSDGIESGAPLARLDAGDIDLGLRYVPECRVLVVADPLDEPGLAVATEAAAYHGAALILLIGQGAAPDGLAENATVLELPAHDDGAFAALVGRYAAGLARGAAPKDAWQEALNSAGWESASESEPTTESEPATE